MREKILKVLRERGNVSGESLAKQFNISRSAVWKHIRELRKKGYHIRSAPKIGYFFIDDANLIVPEEILSGLATRVMGKKIVFKNETSSTQEVADELAKNGAEEGTIVVAECQTRGRGRKGRVWESPPRESVYFSLILRPPLRPVNVIQIPLVAGVALAEAVQKATSLNARIKWPNDVTINNKKVAGILTEMNCELDRVNYIIMGIGININSGIESFPAYLRDIATSLAIESGKKISRAYLLRKFLVEFENLYLDFLANGFQNVRTQWKQLSSILGANVKVIDGNEEIHGKAIDINEDGFLLIATNYGEVKVITSGDVSLRKL